jgi:hypothetical protein
MIGTTRHPVEDLAERRCGPQLLPRTVLLPRPRVPKKTMLRALPGNADQPGNMVRWASNDEPFSAHALLSTLGSSLTLHTPAVQIISGAGQ